MLECVFVVAYCRYFPSIKGYSQHYKICTSLKMEPQREIKLPSLIECMCFKTDNVTVDFISTWLFYSCEVWHMSCKMPPFLCIFGVTFVHANLCMHTFTMLFGAQSTMQRLPYWILQGAVFSQTLSFFPNLIQCESYYQYISSL